MTSTPSNESWRREDVEMDLLLEGLFRLHDADFRTYDRRSLKQKTAGFIAGLGIRSVPALLAEVLQDAATARALCRALVAQETAFFGDAQESLALRSLIASSLGTYAAPKIWLAECLSAEEVFAFAILLAEEGQYDRSLIFATCSNEALLQDIKDGAFPLDRLPAYEESYRRAGGKASLQDYVAERDGRAMFSDALRSRIIWAQYNLGTDSSFNEFQLISCRRSFSDFNASLRRRTLALFHESLSTFGILDVPVPDDIESFPLLMKYRVLERSGIYRRSA